MERDLKQTIVGKAYSVLSVKQIEETATHYIIKGMASTPTPDRMGDIVEPLGAKFKTPMPLLLYHDSQLPVGTLDAAKATKQGIPFEASLPKVSEPGVVQDRINEAIHSIKYRLIAAVSIGFRAVADGWEFIKGTDFSILYKEWEWLELSLVTIPANPEATLKNFDVNYFKTLDQDTSQRTASGPGAARSLVVRLDQPAGAPVISSSSTKGNIMKPQEAIAGFEAKRAATAAAMEAIMQKATDEGSTLNKEESDKYDELALELKTIDTHLDRLRSHAQISAAKGEPVLPTAGMVTDEGKRSPQGEGVIRTNKELPPGIGMARYVKALAFAKGNYQQATEYAKQWDTSTPEVGMALKAAVGAGTTSDSVWAGPLVYAQDFPAAFLEYLRPQTIIGKLTGLSRVPFNIRYGIQDGGSTVGWVGQGLPKAVTKLHFTSGSLGFAKAAGIVVITQELARFSSPSAELKVRDDLTAQMVQFLDGQFTDPGVAAVANVSPASVTNGAGNIRNAANVWSSMANVLTDLRVFLGTFAANEISLQGAYWIMTPDVALNLGLLLNTAGTAFAFPEIDVNGGTFVGLPVIVSNSVPHSTSAGSPVILVVPRHIYMADDGAIAIDASTEASLQMDSAPGTQDATTGTGTSLVSMFQTNSIAVRVERIINWSRARSYGVGYIDNVHSVTNP